MAEDLVRTGRITKVIHVRFAAGRSGHAMNLDSCDGYGIVQGTDGQDVFFVDTAVQDAPFSDLEAGHEALYLMETGPLRRAAKVWVATSRTRIHEQLREPHRVHHRAAHSKLKKPQRA